VERAYLCFVLCLGLTLACAALLLQVFLSERVVHGLADVGGGFCRSVLDE
jgi:hypothetical protein